MKQTIYLFLTILVISILTIRSAWAELPGEWAGAASSVDSGATVVVDVATNKPNDLRPLLTDVYANVEVVDFVAIVEKSSLELGHPMGKVVVDIAVEVMGEDAGDIIDPLLEHFTNSPS